MVKKRWLVLENGRVFEGFAFGADAGAAGEVVFASNMTGFTETVTDPAFAGQLVVQTFPLVGNCGVNPADMEGPPRLSGYIVKELCQTPSHFTCMGTLGTFFTENGIPGMWGADTRALTKLLRNEGTMRGAMTDNPSNVSFDFETKRASVIEPENHPAENAKFKVALWDFGVKKSMIKRLNALGSDVLVVPPGSAVSADGVMLSGGPGNPEDLDVNKIKELLQADVPIFATGLGHQLLALANGGGIEKLKYGHRGGYSVRDLAAGKTIITNQNHGYAVAMDRLPPNARASFINVNDGTCEGLDYTNPSVFSVQFEPGEAQYARFIAAMKGGK